MFMELGSKPERGTNPARNPEKEVRGMKIDKATERFLLAVFASVISGLIVAALTKDG